MGWWKIQGTETLIGDVPLDILAKAVVEVAAAYHADFGRKPTRAEWEALLLAALGAEEDEVRVLADGLARVHLERP